MGDINLYTSRGDGNSLKKQLRISAEKDINLYTSRGDGNPLGAIPLSNVNKGYKPIYLERGRKHCIFLLQR